MTNFRKTTCLTLAAAAIAVASAGRSRIVSRAVFGAPAAPDTPERVAWALLAEADALCRRASRGTVSNEPSPAPSSELAPELAARLAAAGEALEIVREMAAKIRRPGSRASALEAAERLERRCAGERVPPMAPDRLARSMPGADPVEQNALIVPYLKRLNEAASRGAESSRGRLASAAGNGGATPVSTAAGSEPPAERAVESAAARQAASRGVLEPRPDREPERPSIVMTGGTRKHRERVARWSRVFVREAGALRTSRRDLQVEIESYSLADSRAACRSFGSVLARLDSEFEAGAPTRGLSLRVARMLGHYRRGVSECTTGRPAAAFAYLSEGDREWATIAKTASRMFEPRPLRLPNGAKPAVTTLGWTSSAR